MPGASRRRSEAGNRGVIIPRRCAAQNRGGQHPGASRRGNPWGCAAEAPTPLRDAWLGILQNPGILQTPGIVQNPGIL